jgi:hypothetical protein
MRPEGVVSKKLMGLRRTLDNMAACKLPAAFTMVVEARREYAITRIAKQNIRCHISRKFFFILLQIGDSV